jgi:hypothetical protein
MVALSKRTSLALAASVLWTLDRLDDPKRRAWSAATTGLGTGWAVTRHRNEPGLLMAGDSAQHRLVDRHGLVADG